MRGPSLTRGLSRQIPTTFDMPSTTVSSVRSSRAIRCDTRRLKYKTYAKNDTKKTIMPSYVRMLIIFKFVQSLLLPQEEKK